ncbi:MAG: hypothetical protein AABW51_00225 [Nanoarchaeota archaeon]
MGKIGMLFLLIFLFPLIASVSIEIKQEYKSGETLIAKVSGLFLQPIEKSDMVFYRDAVKIPMDTDLGKIGDNFYVKAELNGRTPGNYSIVIQNVRYYNLTEFIDTPFYANFTINSGVADFYVEQGFISTSSNFIINLKSLRDNPIDFDIKTPDGITTATDLQASFFQLKTINFDISRVKKDFIGEMEISSNNTKYIIPISVYGITSNLTSCQSDSDCNSDDQLCTDNICVKKTECTKDGDCGGNEICTNNKCTTKPECDPDNNCPSGEICKNAKCEIKPECTIDNDCNLNRTGFVCANERCIDAIAQKTCQELNGTTCSLTKECVGNSSIIRGYECCLGSCEDKKTSSSGKYWGWGLLIVAVLLLGWFYIKYKGAKRKSIDIGGIAKGKKF